VSSAEDNKALVRRFLEELVRGNLYIIDELLSPDFVDRSLMPGQGPTREDFKRSVAEILEGWTTTAFAIEEQVAEGDTVVTRVSESGVQRGELAGLARAGLEDPTKIIYMHHISGGKIAEEWSTQEPRPLWENLTQQLRERERVEQELQVARRIQHASLPEDLPALEGWQISPFSQPAREVGGDFYDLFELQDGRLGIVVGDATGHGVPAALVMASARSMLRAVAQASDTPGDVLSRVNDPLATDIPSNMFVTCFYAILDPESGSLSYANAGHDLPYLRRHSGECEELRARGMPLGIMPGMSYEQKEVVLEGGEAALFYSDGLVEAHDPEGEMFGFPRLQALVAEHGEENSLEERLLEELYSFVGEGWEQEDDITLLTLRRSAP
jgi:predicted ester cyclase